MKNTLVEYKGGGGSGNFWQWNYFMFDEDGRFVNLYSTGYKGVKDESEANELLESEDYYQINGVEVLSLSDEAAVICFVDNGNASLMKMLSDRPELESVLKAHCNECGDIHHVCDMIAGDESGDGGLAISAKNLYCEDCYYSIQDSYFEAQLKFENVVLTIHDYAGHRNGRAQYSYTLRVDGKILFSGDDYGPSPMDPVGSIGSLIGLLGFLTLKEGDTDGEYFKNYTAAQLEFSQSDLCQELSMICYDYESDEIDDRWFVTEDYTDYGTVYTVEYGE